MKTQPQWLHKNLYPFTSKWTDIDEHALHYIDEGNGDIILFVHGTPEWSFGFRDLVAALRTNFRCIAIDHLGFGLSDKPAAADYGVFAHSARLTKFIHALGLRKINIVANDFGGGIAMGYALEHPENVNRVILFNTWLWSLTNDKHYSGPAKIINTWLGKFLYLRMNLPVNTIMPSAYSDKKKLTREIHDHYRKPVPDGKSRIALYAIAKELMNASPWWQGLWKKLDRIPQDRFMIFWGTKDKFIPPYELAKWKSRLPGATFTIFEDAGHFAQEEKPLEMVRSIAEFLGGDRSKQPGYREWEPVA